MEKISMKDCRSKGEDISRAASIFVPNPYDVKEDPAPFAKKIYTS